MKSLIFILLLSVLQPVYAVGIYKWVDEDGKEIYGNRPPEDAITDEVALPEITIIESKEEFQEAKETSEEQVALPPTKNSDQEKTVIEQKLDVISPKNNDVIRANNGNIEIKFTTLPKLAEAESIVIYLDGKQFSVSRDLTAKLEALDRGTHSLFAVKRDAKGNVIANSNNIKFHILRHSKLF